VTPTDTEALGDLIRPLLRRNLLASKTWTALPAMGGSLDEQEQSWARTFVELVLVADRVDALQDVLDVLDSYFRPVPAHLALGRLHGTLDLWEALDPRRATAYAMKAWVQGCPYLGRMPALVAAGVGDPR
jgi:hypothetical protein